MADSAALVSKYSTNANPFGFPVSLSVRIRMPLTGPTVATAQLVIYDSYYAFITTVTIDSTFTIVNRQYNNTYYLFSNYV